MSSHSHEENLRVAVLSVVKHDYVPLGVIAHPRFQPVVIADDATEPEWVHQRNEELAAELGVPYVRDVERALSDFGAQVAVVSSQPERHCALSVRAANAGLHVVQDKPMSTRLSECDRLVEAVERNKVKFLMWNRNPMPAVLRARQEIESGTIGSPFAVHVDFYFASDQGPPKGSRRPEDKPINWLEAQIAAHPDGRDGGVGIEPMGELKIEGIYPLGYIRALTGADVERVFARTTAHFHQLHFDNGVEDLATVTLEMERGILGTLAIGRIGAAGHPDGSYIKIHVLGSEGALVVNEALPEISIYHREPQGVQARNFRVAGDYEYLLMEDLLHAIETDGTTMLDARAGRAICATVEAAIESGRSGKPVDVA